jgi:hypothetical protein
MLCAPTTPPWSGRDVATMIPPGISLTVVSGCTPGPTTQALIIPRSGLGLFTASIVQTWVAAGGVVLTEYSVSDDVYNAVFGSGAAQTGSYGGCDDTAPTIAQFNPTDRFWVGNSWVSAGNGCGLSDVGSWPGVTPLAGWDATTAAIGYRDYGSGRVWLTEYDWQDNELNPFAYTAGLMGYMIISRR